MLVSLAKLLNEVYFYNKLECFSIMNKNYEYFMKQPSLNVCFVLNRRCFQSAY
jgi:hypothetical protein